MTEWGNVLWDLVALVDDETVDFVCIPLSFFTACNNCPCFGFCILCRIHLR